MTNRAEITTEGLLEGIREWVELETPSADPDHVNRLMDLIATECRALGARVERQAGRDGYGDHLKVDAPWNGDTEQAGILITSHVDTVWPVGTTTERPFKVEDGKAYGPGILDMKSGAYLGFHAFAYMVRNNIQPRLPLTLIFNSDEEVGSPTSRDLIEAATAKAKYALVPEPGKLPGGCVVTGRKGWGRFQVKCSGLAAHAGAYPEQGRSAIVELAHQILALEKMTDYQSGVTVNVGVVHGGTLLNVVPAEAQAEVDLRLPRTEQVGPVTQAILGLQAVTADVSVEVTGGMNRPVFERTDGVVALYQRARVIAEAIGFDLPEITSGGVSDGNFTAALGVPTLCGLGGVGEGPHALHEHVQIESLVPRAKLLVGLVETLD